jgi:hypothetical protein
MVDERDLKKLGEQIRQGLREQSMGKAASSLSTGRTERLIEQSREDGQKGLQAEPSRTGKDTPQTEPTLLSHRLMKTGIGRRRG